jgi:hypothetical protein
MRSGSSSGKKRKSIKEYTPTLLPQNNFQPPTTGILKQKVNEYQPLSRERTATAKLPAYLSNLKSKYTSQESRNNRAKLKITKSRDPYAR